jgi:predicted DNA-binding protein
VDKKILATKEKQLLIRLPKETHKRAKFLAYELEISMADLCKEGLEMIFQKHNKKLEGIK